MDIKTIFVEMTITDAIAILTALGSFLMMWFRFGGTITKLKTITEEQENKIKALRADLEKHRELNELKIEKLADKLDHVGSSIGDKLSSIDRDLIETAVFLKNNVNFLSQISKDNKVRIDDHDKKFNYYDKSITQLLMNKQHN